MPVTYLCICSLQTAVSTSSEASSFSKQQLNDKQQQIIELQKNISEQENNVKEKDITISTLEKEINSLKILSVNEVMMKIFTLLPLENQVICPKVFSDFFQKL